MREAIAVVLAMASVVLLVPSTPVHRVARMGSSPSGTSAPPSPTERLTLRLLRGAGRFGLGPWSRRQRARERLRTIHALAALAAELEAGQAPGVALGRCAGAPPVWPTALAAVQFGGEVAEALESDAAERPVLRQLAACWQVATVTGSGLAASVGRLAESARAAEDVRVDLEGQLAAPRATARLLALLPAVGVGFGVMLGADPLAWLLGTTPGRLCLAAGVLLTLLGAWWTGRIGASVERLL